MRQFLKNEKGSNLILVIVIMMLFMIVVMGLSTVTLFGANSSKVQRNYTQAYYAAKTINMSICDAITSEDGLSITNAWEDDFEENELKNEAYITRDVTTQEILRIEIPTNKLKYTNTNDDYVNILDTNIQVKNKITLKYVKVDDITYKAEKIIVETTAKYMDQSYTMNAELENKASTGGGGSGGTQTGKAKYVLGTTKKLIVNASTFIGGISSNEAIDVQDVTVSGGVFSRKDINILYGSVISGGVLSNSKISVNGITEIGDVIAAHEINLGSTSSSVTGNLISGKSIKIESGSDIDGSIIALEKLNVTGSSMILTKNIFSNDGVYISGSTAKIGGSVVTKGKVDICNGDIVEGDIVAMGDINLTGVAVTGDIISNGNVSITGGSVKGNIYSNGNVKILDSGSVKNIYSNGSVNLAGVVIDGNVEAVGDVDVTYTVSVKNIYSNGKVNIKGVKVYENIKANGSIIAGWDVEVYGKASSNSTITNNTDFIKEPNISVPFPSLSVIIDVEHIIETKMNSLIDAKIQTGIDSIGKVVAVPNDNWEFTGIAPTIGTEEQLNQCISSGVFDTRNGDLHFVTSNDLIIDDNISIIGDHRVFITLTKSNKTLYFLSNNTDIVLAKQLYLISNNPIHIEMEKYIGYNWFYGSTINAQIYMIKGDFDPGWERVTANGIFIIGEINNNGSSGNWYSNLTFNIIQGNYENTSFEGVLGSNSSEPTVINGDWSVTKYYK